LFDNNWKSFRLHFAKPIEAARQKDASDFDIRRGTQKLRELQEKIEPHLLQRKRKNHLKNLPPSYEFDVWVKPSDQQRSLCIAHVNSDKFAETVAKDGTRCVLPEITKLRTLFNHPFLFLDNAYEVRMKEAGPQETIRMSPKLAVFVDLVDTWTNEGLKILCFCQSVKMLKIIEYVLLERENVRVCSLTGQTSSKRRTLLVEDFNREVSLFNVMLLSIKAGGEGLNLTGACRSVLFDPGWTQAESDQAVARISRPGQTRECEIIHFIMAGTVEERVSL